MSRFVFLVHSLRSGHAARGRVYGLLWKVPLAAMLGLFLGLPVGAIYLPYLALHESTRKLGQVWPYLAGWTEWSENRAAATRPKPGWLLVWLIWAWLYFVSAFTWAPVVGCAVGPILGVWVVVARDGWSRFLAAARRWRESLQAFDLGRLARV